MVRCRKSRDASLRLPTSDVVRSQSQRGGFSYLELQVAFALFALALSGLGPLTVMHSKQVAELERRFEAGTTYYLTPSSQRWARKLGASAAITSSPPPPPSPASTTLIDNADFGYSEEDAGTIDWHTVANAAARGGDYRRQNGWIGADKAFWDFAGLRPGWYQIWVTWPPVGNHATNSPYSIYDGGSLVSTVAVDQTLTPSGPLFAGSPWESLGAYLISADNLRVELTDNANNFISADAVRIVPITNSVTVQTVTKSLSSDTVSAVVNVEVGTP